MMQSQDKKTPAIGSGSSQDRRDINRETASVDPAMSNTYRLTLTSVLAAVALLFSYVETVIPMPIGVPGSKLGLANILIVLALYLLGLRYALSINVIRIALAAMLFGSPFSFAYSMAGGLFGIAIMTTLGKTGRFSVIGISMAGGVAHNLGQILVAVLVMRSPGLIMYLPILIFTGIATGIINGFIAHLILKHAAGTLKINHYISGADPLGGRSTSSASMSDARDDVPLHDQRSESVSARK